MSEATETLERLEAIVRRGLTTRVGLLGFEARCKLMAQLLYDSGARLYPYPVEADEVDAAELDGPAEIALHANDREQPVAVHPEPDPADGYDYDYGSAPKADLGTIRTIRLDADEPEAVPGVPAPVRDAPGAPVIDLRVWSEGEPEPSGRPAVVCADGVTALWDAEHEGWSRQLVTHHPVPEDAPEGSVGATTLGVLGETWVDLLADFGPVREATEYESRLVAERWLDAEDKAS